MERLGKKAGNGSLTKQHARAAPAESARFEQFLEYAPDAIVAVDADGKIVVVNAQTELLFGYSRKELLGQPGETLVPERSRGVQSENRAEFFTDPATRPLGAGLELFGLRKNRTEFPAEVSVSRIDAEEGTLRFAAIRDVTDRAEADRDLRALAAELDQTRRVEAAELVQTRRDEAAELVQTRRDEAAELVQTRRVEADELEETRRFEAVDEREKLEAQLNQLRRLESVGQLAGGIAHDFNNLLGIILNYAQFVQDEIGEDSPAARDVEEIRRAAERAAALTRQLLIFSRREVVRKRVLDLNEVVSELDRLLARALGEQVELETHLASGLWPVEADPGQIEQVLVNLAVNARDAMSVGGRLVIETSNHELLEERAGASPGRYVRLTVSDTGAGMDQQVADHAFEPFFTTKPKGAGTGLGLSTVYGIVTEAGGQIELYSEPGVGTTVKVYLPATDRGPTPAARPRPPRADAAGETVLLVEDEQSVRRLSERILKGAGYEVLVTASGQEALEMCARPEQRIDLLVTDVVMPGMLGPELVERATAVRPGLKVVFMSGYVHQMIDLMEGDRGDFAFIEKPFTVEALLDGVREALDIA
jgi:PAS domain S-box-containing protein